MGFWLDFILKIFDLVIVFVVAILTYYFGIRKLLKERELTREEASLSRREDALYRKIDLYKQLIENIPKLTDEKVNKEELKNNLNKFGKELLLFAPDNIYKEYVEVLKKIRKLQPANVLSEFMIILRKELIPDTTLKASDIIEIERFD